MNPYAENPVLRTRQQLSDAAAVAWMIGCVLLGRALYRTVDQLRTATSSAEDAGAGLAARLDDVARGVARIPVVGGDLRLPFAKAADAGRSLEAAGAAAGDTVHSIALWLGIVVALLPIVWLLTRYLPRRLSWIREAAAARHLRSVGDGGLHLFALRALASRPLHQLRRVTTDPAGSFARGDYAALAELELAHLGLRLGGPPALTSRS